MIREALKPWRHKVAVAASILLVAILTVIGVITGNTASRQDNIEHVVKVERVRVNSALCSSGSQFTIACRHHAIRVMEACVATRHCAVLLRAIREGKVALPPLPHRYPPAPPESPSGGAELAAGAGHSPAPPIGQGGGGQHHSPPAPPSGDAEPPPRHHQAPPPAASPPSEAPPPATSTSTAEPPGEPEPEGKAKGLTECVAAVDVPCVGNAVGAVVESTVEAAKGAVGR